MNSLLQFISGKKTYLTCATILALLFGTWQGWWTIPQPVYAILFTFAVGFLRAGMKKGPDDPGDPPAAPAADPDTKTPASKSPGPMLMLAFASLALMVCSCNTPPQTITYRAAGTAVVSVDTAMNFWGAYVETVPRTNAVVVAQLITQENDVMNAYDKYRASMAVACDAGAIYAATSVTNATKMQQTFMALQQATSTASQNLTDLENLITSYGVKLQ